MYKSSPAFSIKGKCNYSLFTFLDNQTNFDIKPSPFAYDV
jgi:hypothetical protein